MKSERAGCFDGWVGRERREIEQEDAGEGKDTVRYQKKLSNVLRFEIRTQEVCHGLSNHAIRRRREAAAANQRPPVQQQPSLRHGGH